MGNVGNTHFKKGRKGTECENPAKKATSSPDLDFIPKMFQSQGVIGGGLLGGVFHPVHGATSAQESFSDLWAQTPRFYVRI